MLALLEIVRAALFTLARRLGPWLVLFAVLVGGTYAYDREACQTIGHFILLALIVAVLPIMTGTLLRRSLHAGPLGLIAGGNGYLSTVGYGLGAALLAAPFAVGIAVPLDGRPGWLVASVTAGVVFAVSWLGAAAGRLASGGAAIAALTWLGAAIVTAAGFGVGTLLELLHQADALEPQLSSTEFLGAAAVAAGLVSTHLLLLIASRLDRRSPALARP